MALVAAALPAMVGAVGTSVRGTGLASRQAIALELARGRLEELTGLPYGALLAGGLSDAVEVGGRPYERLVTVAALDPETDAESGEDAWTTGWAAVRVEVDGVVLEARVTGP
ncbi:MAG: hypothetical protein HY722_01965 [Planctomycetes bacterium]|nr:hypothetical protein [Planctomycetota bacterium]